MIGDCTTIRKLAVSYGMPDERIVTFPWGVDLRHFSPAPAEAGSSTFTLFSTRGWEPIYGVDVIARAFVQAARLRPELRLVMLGNGSLAGDLRQTFQKGGVESQVLFPGQVSQADLPRYYRLANLYISASHSDGTSISLLEAMACGRPSLVSDIPGNREWVNPGENGWWFKDGDADSLAQGIMYASEHRELLHTMGKSARRTAEQRADWEKNFPLLLDGYRLALSQAQVWNPS
jgi:glycosyltransferase involved in cell wall biosynthesis